MKRLDILFSILLLCFLLHKPQIVCAQNLSDTIRQIDDIFSDLDNDSPGASIRVTRGDRVIYAKDVGLSNLEHEQRIDEKTIFEAGSVSKQFTATAILLLAQKEKLGLDDDIRLYVTEFPDYGTPITIRNLLNHTSGIRDWGVVASIGGWPRGTRVYTNDLALDIITRQDSLNYKPGDKYSYSNSNYTLLTIIVERVSGKTLPGFTDEFIFKPLQMNHTSWRNNFNAIVKNRATGYARRNGRFVSNMPFENTYGHAALLTSADDLDKWNKSWKNNPLGGEELLEMRQERGRLNNGSEIVYAGGVKVDSYNEYVEVSHSGATAGYRSWMAYYPDDDLSVVYISNNTYLPTVKTGRKIAEVFFGSESEKTESASKSPSEDYKIEINELESLEGIYYSPESKGTYKIWVENNELWLDDYVRRKIRLKPVDHNSFEANNRTYIFKKHDDGFHLYVSATRANNVKFTRK